MKHKITFFAVLMMALAFPQSVKAQAYDFTSVAPSGQTLYYKIVNGTAQVTPELDDYNWYSDANFPSGNLVIPATVTYNGTEYAVTSIGDYAFHGCTGLTSVSIPPSINSIGYAAFFQCNITSFTIPNSVTSISGHLFDGCTNLSSITIPNSVTNIGLHAFTWCRSLTSINIPNTVTEIGMYAFKDCTGLTSITIPQSVNEIVCGAFKNCSNLTSITLLRETPPYFSWGWLGGIFDGVPSNAHFYVPCGTVASYRAWDGLNGFTNIRADGVCLSIYAEGNDIVVDGAEGNAVTLYGSGDNVLSTVTAQSGTPVRFENLASGTYYVKIGILPAKMKVVVE